MDPIPLSNFKIQDKGIVTSIDDNELMVAFLEMGILEGTAIELVHIAPLGDPIAIMIGSYTLTLRKSEAAHIWMNKL